MKIPEGGDGWQRAGGTDLNGRALLAATASASAGLVVALSGKAAGGAARQMPEIRWRKQGLMLSPEGAPLWRSLHCGMPCVLPWNHGGYRIFLTGKQPGTEYQIGWIDLTKDLSILRENPANPVLVSGRLGTFDSNGVVMPMVVRVSDSVLYMYYTAWLYLAKEGIFQHSLGLAISRDNGDTWNRYSEGPILSLDPQDPFAIGTVHVMRERNDFWRMWYTSVIEWRHHKDGHPFFVFHIKYAESEDGIHWNKPKDTVAIPLQEGERGASRPMVLKENGRFRMWFSQQMLDLMKYRIGYAESADGRNWARWPSGIEPSKNGWDSEMVEYAWVLRRPKDYLMFYNGNGFGGSGTGTAIGTVA